MMKCIKNDSTGSKFTEYEQQVRKARTEPCYCSSCNDVWELWEGSHW